MSRVPRYGYGSKGLYADINRESARPSIQLAVYDSENRPVGIFFYLDKPEIKMQDTNGVLWDWVKS